MKRSLKIFVCCLMVCGFFSCSKPKDDSFLANLTPSQRMAYQFFDSDEDVLTLLEMEFQLVVRENPNDKNAWQSLANIYHLQENFDKEIEALRKIYLLSLYEKPLDKQMIIESWKTIAKVCMQNHDIEKFFVLWKEFFWKETRASDPYFIDPYAALDAVLQDNSSESMETKDEVTKFSAFTDEIQSFFEKKIQERPDEVEAWLALQHIYGVKKLDQRRMDMLEKGIFHHNSNPKLWLAFASLYYPSNMVLNEIEREKIGGHIAELRQVMSQSPNRNQHWEALGRFFIALDHFPQIVKLMEEDLGMPKSPEMWLALAKLYDIQEGYAIEASVIEQALLRFPKDIPLQTQLIQAYAAKPETIEKSDAAIQKLAALDPEGAARFWSERGFYYLKRELFDKAWNAYHYSQKLAPNKFVNLAKVYVEMGEILYVRNQMEKAMQLWGEATKFKNEKSATYLFYIMNAWKGLIQADIHLEKIDAAMEKIREFVRAYPQNTATHLGVLLNIHNENDFANMREKLTPHLDRILQEKPQDDIIWLVKAYLCSETDDVFFETMEQSIQAGCNNYEAWADLAQELESFAKKSDDAKLKEKAPEIWGKATQAKPQVAAFWKFLGFALAEQGNTAKAILAFEKSARLDPYNENSLRALADIYEKNNQPEKAERILTRAKVMHVSEEMLSR